MKIKHLSILAAFAVGAANASAQGFSDTFSSPEYSGTDSEDIGFALTGQNGWDTNDPFMSSPDRGDTNFVAFVPGYTEGSFAAGNYSAIFGGQQVLDNYFPGRPDPDIFKDFTPVTPSGSMSASQLTAEFAIIKSVEPGFLNEDTFGFDLRDSGGDSLAKFQFVPGSTIPGADLDFEWTLNGVVQTTANPSLTADWAISYDAKYRLEALLDADSRLYVWLVTLNASNEVVARDNFISAGGVSGGGTGSDFAQIAVTWQLAETTATNPPENNVFGDSGSNYIVLTEVSVEAAVPEPAHYAVACGALVLVILAARRRRGIRA